MVASPSFVRAACFPRLFRSPFQRGEAQSTLWTQKNCPTYEQTTHDNRSRVEQGTTTTPESVGAAGNVCWPHRCLLTMVSMERLLAVCVRDQERNLSI
jgi:hypothetical protein